MWALQQKHIYELYDGIVRGIRAHENYKFFSSQPVKAVGNSDTVTVDAWRPGPAGGWAAPAAGLRSPPRGPGRWALGFRIGMSRNALRRGFRQRLSDEVLEFGDVYQ